MYWKKLTHDEISATVFKALAENVNYREKPILGIPGTYLDAEEFYDDAPFLKDAPFMSTLIANPNHIGCHTLGEESLSLFKGTQQIEIDLIKICAEEIFNGNKDEQDGYVAPGGTEANIQAMWIYRNYFIKEYKAKPEEIAIVYTVDSHYSMPKAANLLGLQSIVLNVHENSREFIGDDLDKKINGVIKNGVKYFIVIANLSTTMFGSIDDANVLGKFFEEKKLHFRLHVDAAFGGFIYPFNNPDSKFSFQNKYITSFTIDAHKMLQTPYGTGIFLIRKGFMKYVKTEEAQYIPGKDYTLCGSRSGANAISIWMILRIHGSEGWKAKMLMLNDHTSGICNKLKEMNIEFFRNPFLNIIAIKNQYISEKLANKYYLVADSYTHKPKWWKIVVMPHVKRGTIDQFLSDLRAELK